MVASRLFIQIWKDVMTAHKVSLLSAYISYPRTASHSMTATKSSPHQKNNNNNKNKNTASTVTWKRQIYHYAIPKGFCSNADLLCSNELTSFCSQNNYLMEKFPVFKKGNMDISLIQFIQYLYLFIFSLTELLL